ncbi:hypothetical protein GCM10027061_24260 [Nesterenkonia suensis]
MERSAARWALATGVVKAGESVLRAAGTTAGTELSPQTAESDPAVVAGSDSLLSVCARLLTGAVRPCSTNSAAVAL